MARALKEKDLEILWNLIENAQEFFLEVHFGVTYEDDAGHRQRIKKKGIGILDILRMSYAGFAYHVKFRKEERKDELIDYHADMKKVKDKTIKLIEHLKWQEELLDHDSKEVNQIIIKSLESESLSLEICKKILKYEIESRRRETEKQSGEDESEKTEKGGSSASIVEKNLSEFKNEFVNKADYPKAIKAVEEFFLGKHKPINTPVFVKNKNIKNLAFALGEIWKSKQNKPITFEYLQFYKKTFSIFENQKIDKRNVFGCNLYKYSISKT